MIDNINNNALPEGSLKSHQPLPGLSHTVKKGTPSPASGPEKAGAMPLDDTLQIRFDTLIEKAKQHVESDHTAVQQARELLMSGKLDTLDHIRQAAENIIKLGI